MTINAGGVVVQVPPKNPALLHTDEVALCGQCDGPAVTITVHPAATPMEKVRWSEVRKYLTAPPRWLLEMLSSL
jgi:hypothetical protein